ncbi:MAG: alpha/beta hydrolase family protein [Myxococcales bacterium]
MSESLRIPARGDGHALAAELFLPPGPPKAAVLIAGAMAVRAGFYAALARYLAQQGASALIFDYRGIGGSRPPGKLREFQATFHDWGERDLAGCLDWLGQRFSGLPLLFIGHSAGAQLMGLAPSAPIRAAVFAAAGTAYWKTYAGLHRAVLASLFFAGFPAALALAGYLPLSKVGQGDDVPAGVAREWVRWARDRRYVYSYAEPRGGLGYASYARPLLALSVADDAYAPPASTAHLLSLYRRAEKEVRTIRPGPKPIGHFGFFRQPDLWADPVRWLLARAGSA